MDYHDVAVLPYKACLSAELQKNYDRRRGHGAATYLKTVVMRKRGHASCKKLFLQQSVFSCHLNLMGIIRLSQS